MATAFSPMSTIAPPPSGAGYHTIPDTEDVTPVSDGPISALTKRARKSFKFLFFGLFILIVIAIVVIFGLRMKSSLNNSVKIYQTSQSLGHSIKEINANEIKRMGFDISKLEFGNAQCSIIDQKSNKCTPPTRRTSKIQIDANNVHQTILGFGGAFTEAAAHNFYKLPALIQQKVIDLYFGPNGIGYSIGRLAINSCDFALGTYSFDDVPNDYDLLYFDSEVTHDQVEILPFIRRAMAASKHPIKLLASPWSPPAWMKRGQGVSELINQSMLNSATPNGLINTDAIKTTWAKYISKFMSAYADKGAPIWAVTPQNEPEFAAPWEACSYTDKREMDFVSGYLGPTLRQDHPDVLIFGFDHNKDHLFQWGKTMLTGKGHKYVDGMAFHWYGYNNDRYIDGTFGYDNVNFTHHLSPKKLLLATEGCSCPGVAIKSQLRAERLVHDVLYDINNHAHGWIDWNLLVDAQGGPNHLGNNCDAPIVTNEDFTDIIVQPKYAYFGQISKFVPPGSVRVHSTVVGSYGYQKTNPNVRPGFELSLYYCEQSVRQLWSLDASTGLLGLIAISVDEETTPIYTFEPLCVGSGTGNRPFLSLVFCSGVPTLGDGIVGDPIYKPLSVTLNKQGQLVDSVSGGMCITLANGVAEAGALLNLQTCAVTPPASTTGGGLDTSVPDNQRFYYESVTGELTSYVNSGVMVEDEDNNSDKTDEERNKQVKLCVTAGWPFLYGTAFVTTPTIIPVLKTDTASNNGGNDKKETVFVLVNEANLSTHVILSDVSGTTSVTVTTTSMSAAAEANNNRDDQDKNEDNNNHHNEKKDTYKKGKTQGDSADDDDHDVQKKRRIVNTADTNAVTGAGNKKDLWFGIKGRSIQTIVY